MMGQIQFLWKSQNVNKKIKTHNREKNFVK